MYTEEEMYYIESVSIVTACIGFLGALFMSIMILLFKNNRSSFPFRLVLYLALSDAGVSLIIMTGPYKSHDSLCKIQGVLRSFFSLASVLWVDIIAWVPYKTLTSHQKLDSFEKYILGGVLGYSLTMSLLPLLTDSYAESATGFCWLSEQKNRTIALSWQLVQFYIPLWASYIFTTLAYYRVTKLSQYLLNAVQSMDENSRAESLKNINKLKFYPTVLLLTYLFGTANRVYLFFWPTEPSVVLTCLQNGFANLLGLFNCLVYGLNQQVRMNLRNCFLGTKEDHDESISEIDLT